jgi:hypothetical protein
VKSPVIITSIVIIFLIPTLTTAELSITAGLKPRSEFNDNIFLDRSDNEGKESDFISRIGPELKLDYASRSIDTKLTYSYERRNYIRNNYDSLSNSNDGFGHIKGSYLLSRNKTLELGYSVVASGVSGFKNIAPRPEKPEGPVADEIEGFGDTQGGATFTRRFDATFKRRGKINSTANAYASDIDYSESNRKDELRGFTLRFARQLSGRTTAFIRGLAEKRNFIGGGLNSEVTSYRYSFETSLSYRLTSRFTANVGYSYNTEKSSREESEYSNNVLWFRIGVNLPELQKIIK